MWVITELGTAVNLSRMDDIFVDVDDFTVVASATKDVDVSYDIKKFDNRDDAKKYVAELVEKLNKAEGDEN